MSNESEFVMVGKTTGLLPKISLVGIKVLLDVPLRRTLGLKVLRLSIDLSTDILEKIITCLYPVGPRLLFNNLSN